MHAQFAEVHQKLDTLPTLDTRTTAIEQKLDALPKVIAEMLTRRDD